MHAKDLKQGDTFTIWEQNAHTVCLKTEDGHAYRLKDGSIVTLAHNRRVDLLKPEEHGFTVAEYSGRLVLAKRLDGSEGSTPRYVIKSFVPVETSFVISSDIRGIGETSAAIRKEVNTVPTIPPQVVMLLQELEQALNRGTSFLQVVKMLLQVSVPGGDVYHNQIMVNVGQLPIK